jgi:N-acetylglucosamine-6-phosphate deacetylase
LAETLIAAERIVPATSPPHGSPQRAGDLPDIVSPGYVLLRDGHIASIGQGRPNRVPDVDIYSGVLVPGFVDIQVNGYFGAELDAVNADEWQMVAARLPETGTTAFMPTFITAPVPRLAEALRAARALTARLPERALLERAATERAATERAATERAATERTMTSGTLPAGTPPAARILGVHLEGPFISPLRAGAHNKDWMTEPTAEAVSQLLDAGQGILRLVTLAPELPGALGAIKALTQAGVLVSVGHSDALADQVSAAADAGARMVTHLFNAQRPLHHREPGVVGQALADHRLTSGLIADFEHVLPPVCQIAFAAAPGRVLLVTDAAACAGMPPGRYMLGGEPIDLPDRDGAPPVRLDGTLAGSALRMDVAVANMVSAGTGLPDAVAAATRIPADLIGQPELGRITHGARADLTWLGEDLRARATWVAGELAYSDERQSEP